MKHVNSLILYSGGAYLLLNFSLIYGLNVKVYVTVLTLLFLSYSFIAVLAVNKTVKATFIPLSTGVVISVAGILLLLFDIGLLGFYLSVTGCCLMILFYNWRFLLKKERDVMDILKLALVITFCAFCLFKLLRWPNATTLGYTSLGVGVVTYIYFLFARPNESHAHRSSLPRTTMNAEEIRKSTKAGCYSCGTIFQDVNQVTYDGATAICPVCSRAALIGEPKYVVTEYSLAQLKRAVEREQG